MAKFPRAALAALFVVFSGLAAAAQGCDSNYPWLCKPVPSVEPPESAEPASKPPTINSKRRTAKATKQADERLTRKERRAQRAAERREASRQARAEQAETARAEEVEAAPVVMPRRRPRAAGPRVVEAEPNSGFMAAWTERTGTPAETARPATTVAMAGPALASAESRPAVLAETKPVAAEPPPPPMRVAAQNEVNEIDLAAGDPPAARSDSSWLRNLFLAFGGLIAFGSAVRMFV